MDIISKERRSELMRRVRPKDTKPEIAVRRIVHSLGARFRLHYRNLVGKPDSVFIGKRKLIFVHGCYWHRHPGCKKASTPASNQEFWDGKFQRNVVQRNVERDAIPIQRLEADGWKVLIVWECETKDKTFLRNTLASFLDI